jgi:hypothetical protein
MKKNNRKSKSETRLFKFLSKKLPDLKIISGDTKTCNGFELDISIPELKLAIEWNGILHREPIYGKDKLNYIKNNDRLKRKILAKKDWSIITIEDIDSKSPLQYSKIALDIIIKMIKDEEYLEKKSFTIKIEKGLFKTG